MKEYFFETSETINSLVVDIDWAVEERRCTRTNLIINIYEADEDEEFGCSLKESFEPIGQLFVDVFDIGRLTKLDMSPEIYLDDECADYLYWYENILETVKTNNRNNVAFIYHMSFTNEFRERNLNTNYLEKIVVLLKAYIDYLANIKIDWVTILSAVTIDFMYGNVPSIKPDERIDGKFVRNLFTKEHGLNIDKFMKKNGFDIIDNGFWQGSWPDISVYRKLGDNIDLDLFIGRFYSKRV